MIAENSYLDPQNLEREEVQRKKQRETSLLGEILRQGFQ